MKTADAHPAVAPTGHGRAVTGVPLVARLHVDLCRCVSAACRA